MRKLNNNRESQIQSKFMENYREDLEKAKTRIINLFAEFNISFCFIGGVARNEYASSRITEDIDLLVDIADKPKLSELPIGYIRELSSGRMRVFSLQDPKTKIELIFSGERAGNSEGIEYLPPHLLSDDSNHCLFLSSLIAYKLSAGMYGRRYKDYGDIQDLIRENDLSKSYAQRWNMRQDLIELYERLWEEKMVDIT